MIRFIVRLRIRHRSGLLVELRRQRIKGVHIPPGVGAEAFDLGIGNDGADDGILAVGSEVKAVAMEALARLVDEDSELISIYNGADFSDEETELLTSMVEEAYGDIDVEANYGGQPIYYCILSVE